MKYCEAAYILPSLINVKPLDPGLPVMFFDMVNVYLLDVVILRRPWGIIQCNNLTVLNVIAIQSSE